MCTAPRVSPPPPPRNVLQIYGRTLDLDKEVDRIDYQNLQRLEAEGRIDRQGREIPPSEPEPEPAGPLPPQAGSAAQTAEPPPRPVTRGEKEAKRRTSGQARVSGRAPEILAGSRLGHGNSAKKMLLGG